MDYVSEMEINLFHILHLTPRYDFIYMWHTHDVLEKMH